MRIVILGAGFGGVYAARDLAKNAREEQVQITLVNPTNYFLFTPLLHEVATGGLGPISVSESLREIFAGTRVRIVRGETTQIDLAKRHVGLGNMRLEYDALIIATGARTAWYGVPGAEDRALPLKTLEDALRIRRAVIMSFERACSTTDPEERRRILALTVVGGGATGVELAAELCEFARGIAERYHRCGSQGISGSWSVTLVNAGPELLPQFHQALRSAALRRLKAMGVQVLLNAAVGTVDHDAVVLTDRRRVEAGTIVWSAGVRPHLPQFVGTITPALSGERLTVDRFLRLQGLTDAYALGDSAATLDDSGMPVPMLAQAAVAEAAIASANIIATLRKADPVPFRYRSKGSLVSLGQWYAVGEIFYARFSGRFAWWLWRTVYLFKFLSWRKRIRIAFEWTINLFYPRDVTE